MNAIEELTLKQIKELIAMFKGTTNTPSTNEDDSHWEIGMNIYHNKAKHVGAILSNMVKRGLLRRVKCGVFDLVERGSGW